jgi:hypothetical protein
VEDIDRILSYFGGPRPTIDLSGAAKDDWEAIVAAKL